MKRSETAELLTVISGVDRREVTDLVVASWHEVLAPLSLAACREAVRRHRARSTEWLQPAHVIAIVGDELAAEVRRGALDLVALEDDVAVFEALGGTREQWMAFEGDLGEQERAIRELQARAPEPDPDAWEEQRRDAFDDDGRDLGSSEGSDR